MADIPAANDVVQGVLATGVVGLLVKALVEVLRSRNGHGHVTREDFAAAQATVKADLAAAQAAVKREFEAAQAAMKDHIDLKTGHLDEKIDRIEEGFAVFRKAQHDRWDRINPLPATVHMLDKRVTRLEDKTP